MMQKGAFIDLDHTLYNGFLFFEWANFLHREGMVSLIDLARMDETVAAYKLGIYDYFTAAEHVSKELGQMIDGKKVESVLSATGEFAKTTESRFFGFARSLIRLLKDKGFRVVFVTNEPDFLAEMIKGLLSADDAIGLDFKIKGGIFTKEVENDLFSQYGKAQAVKRYSASNDISLKDSIAIGDSEGDISMLGCVGKGFLINARDSVKKTAGENVRVVMENEELTTIEEELRKNTQKQTH